MMDTEKIYHLLAEACECDVDVIKKAPPEEDLISLGMTSISFITFIIKVEEEFNIEINDSDLLLENFGTVSLCMKTLASYISTEIGEWEPTLSMKKGLILDCDNVLWKGISGDERIIIDEQVVMLHSCLRDLYQKGVILCLCSKNEYNIVHETLNLIDTDFNMDMIAIEKINRKDKATNISDILAELNMMADSFVFLDDSEYELGYVNKVFPEILSIKADYYDMSFVETIKDIFYQTPQSSLDRTKLYREQKERQKEKGKYISIADYNASLKTVMSCHVSTKNEIPRISELSMRTRQFNLSDAHYSVEEITNFYNSDGYKVISLTASDKYGDLGLVGASIINENTIIAFMLSCRVFDRGFEYVMIDTIKALYNTPLKGVYVGNGKNSRFIDFYKDNGIETR